ncbi:MAG: lysophospholipid acyltransferase family protein [Bacteroidales bacterium]
MDNFVKKLKQPMSKILFLLLSGPIYLLSLLPLGVHYFFSDILTFFIGRVLGYRRSVVTINISRSFPEFRYDKIDDTVKKFYNHFAEVIAESIWMISASPRQIAKIVKIENPELIRNFYENGQSVLLCGGHIGNWEFYSRLNSFKGAGDLGFRRGKNKIAYKKQHSELSDRFAKWSRGNGKDIVLIESNSMARAILKNRDDKSCYYLLADQSPMPGSKFAATFLNQYTFMINGPEVISRSAALPVVYFEMERIKRGSYNVKFTTITQNAGDTPVGFITEKFASLMEQSIGSDPSNWLWTHKRWKRGVEENNLKLTEQEIKR